MGPAVAVGRAYCGRACLEQGAWQCVRPGQAARPLVGAGGAGAGASICTADCLHLLIAWDAYALRLAKNQLKLIRPLYPVPDPN